MTLRMMKMLAMMNDGVVAVGGMTLLRSQVLLAPVSAMLVSLAAPAHYTTLEWD